MQEGSALKETVEALAPIVANSDLSAQFIVSTIAIILVILFFNQIVGMVVNAGWKAYCRSGSSKKAKR